MRADPGLCPPPSRRARERQGQRSRVPGRHRCPPARRPGLRGFVLAVLLESLLWQSAPWREPWLRAESAFRSFAVRGATCQVSNRGGCRPRFGSGCGAAVGRGHGRRGASASAVRAERSGPFPRGSLRPGAQTWRLPRVRACARGGGSGQQPLHPGVDEGEAAEQVLVHAVDEPAVGGGQPRPLAQELLVEVAAVARRFLGRGWGGEEGRDSAAGPSPRRGSPRPGPGRPPEPRAHRGSRGLLVSPGSSAYWESNDVHGKAFRHVHSNRTPCVQLTDPVPWDWRLRKGGEPRPDLGPSASRDRGPCWGQRGGSGGGPFRPFHLRPWPPPVWGQCASGRLVHLVLVTRKEREWETDSHPRRRAARRPAQLSGRIYRTAVESRARPALPGTGVTAGLLLTTLGLNGGSISFLSSSSQLISRNRGCWRMSPLTPSLFSGSLTKS